MPDIRYVILSDLHFGAENSILTALDDRADPCADPTRCSPVLSAFADCLAEIVQANEGADPPTLILAGDVLELALADDEVAIAVFEQFSDLVLGEHRLFDDEIWFVPGNHDHHLWETAREQRYAEQIRALGATDPIPPPWHATRMFERPEDPVVPADLLTSVVQRHRKDSTVRVRTFYPNLGISGDGDRCVIVHHGHFIESMYLLMSNLNLVMFDRPVPRDVWQLETDNFAWIDFFWSSLGRSGDVGQDVSRLYDMLQSEEAMQRLGLTLATAIAERAPGGRARRWVTARVVRDLMAHLARRATRLERHHPTEPLSANAQLGLQEYLEGPLLAQITAERDEVPETTLVFGHTHKPFEATRDATGYSAPVDLANTGGWVVDTTEPNPLQGAAAVIVDENLRVASLRLYNQMPDDAQYQVRIAPVGDADSDLVNRLSGLVHPESGTWRALSDAVAQAVPLRQRALATIIQRSTSGDQ
jgi:UDP-2,3-diacylglucosamine pyrophosphatase LpxH